MAEASFITPRADHQVRSVSSVNEDKTLIACYPVIGMHLFAGRTLYIFAVYYRRLPPFYLFGEGGPGCTRGHAAPLFVLHRHNKDPRVIGALECDGRVSPGPGDRDYTVFILEVVKKIGDVYRKPIGYSLGIEGFNR